MSNGEQQSREILFLKGKLNALSAIIRVGHEAFAKNDLLHWAAHVVNNSIIAIPYSRSALVDMRGIPRIIAVSGQPEVKRDSEYCQELPALVAPFSKISKITPLDSETLASCKAGKDAFEALEYLMKTSIGVYLVPISECGLRDAESCSLIWVVEFAQKEQAAVAPAILSLLREHYCESLQYILNRRNLPIMRRLMERRAWFRPSRILIVLLILFCVSAVVIRMRLTVSADFELIPEKEIIAYSPFDGVLSKCHYKSGDHVKKGDIVLHFDTEERSFNLNNARNEYNRSSETFELICRQSFRDADKRGQVKLLELQRDKSAIEVARYKWYLERSAVRAEGSGILDIGGDISQLEGKAVRPGEKLFEILDTENLIAEVSLDERNASVLVPGFLVTLYLHARPGTSIRGEILTVTPKPVLTERGTYCYLIRVGLKDGGNAGDLICGMRGVARVSGPRVSLGYYLFRHIILWYRKL
jgi:hypothetical protein